jgi:hypothetical protein
VILTLPTAQAQVVELKLKHSKIAPAKLEVSKQLTKIKSLQNSKNWKACVQLMPSVYEKEVTLRGWLMVTWLTCARQNLKENKTLVSLNSALAKLEKNKSLILESSARKPLQDEVWQSRAALIEVALKGTGKSDYELVDRQILALWDLGVSRDEKAKLLAWSGELAQLRHQLNAAESFFQQSLDLVDTKAVRDRLDAVQLALNIKPTEIIEASLSSDRTLSEGEAKFEERFRVSLQNNDLISFVEDATTYLNQFPNGRRAKWAFDKIMDIYQSFADKAAEEKFASLRSKVLSQLEKLDSSRAFETAKSLHRRGDFEGSFRMAERGLVGLSQSPQSAQLIYIAGRAAQFSGEYKKARKSACFGSST